jgi:hypothetical protein
MEICNVFEEGLVLVPIRNLPAFHLDKELSVVSPDRQIYRAEKLSRIKESRDSSEAVGVLRPRSHGNHLNEGMKAVI